ncbi:hypothetical protein X801_04679, partial [Opisthorchis viverrini]
LRFGNSKESRIRQSTFVYTLKTHNCAQIEFRKEEVFRISQRSDSPPFVVRDPVLAAKDAIVVHSICGFHRGFKSVDLTSFRIYHRQRIRWRVHKTANRIQCKCSHNQCRPESSALDGCFHGKLRGEFQLSKRNLNQDFTATVKYDDSTASQTTLGFTKIVSINGWDGTHTHAPDATSGNFYYNVSTEAKSGSSEDTTAKYSSTIPVSSTVHSNTGDGGESRISTAEYTDKGTGTGQQSTSSYSNTTYSGPDDNLTNQASTSNYT